MALRNMWMILYVYVNVVFEAVLFILVTQCCWVVEVGGIHKNIKLNSTFSLEIEFLVASSVAVVVVVVVVGGGYRLGNV